MGGQFQAWSIDDVRKALSQFDKYKHFKFEDLNTVRDKLYTEWPEFYKVLDSITLDHIKKRKILERSRRHASCLGYAMQKDPNARVPSIHEGDSDDENKKGDSDNDSEKDDSNAEYIDDDESGSGEEESEEETEEEEIEENSEEDDDSNSTTSNKKKKGKKKKKKKKKENSDDDSDEVDSDDDDDSNETDSDNDNTDSDNNSENNSQDADEDNDNNTNDNAFIEDKSKLRMDFDVRYKSPMFFGYTLYTTEEEDYEETGALEEAMRNDEADAKAQEKMEMAEIVGEVDAKIKKLNGMREARQRKRNKKIQQRERLRGRRLKEKQEAEKAYVMIIIYLHTHTHIYICITLHK